MNPMIKRGFAFSLCALTMAGVALADPAQDTASKDAQYGETAQAGSALKPPAAAGEDASNSAAAAAGATTPAESAKPDASASSNASASPNASASAAGSAQYSDAELKKFVDAAKNVDKVKLNYEGKLSAAKGQAEIDKVRKEADAELTKAVEAKGLTVEQYNKIHQSAMQDPQVLAKIKQYM